MANVVIGESGRNIEGKAGKGRELEAHMFVIVGLGNPSKEYGNTRHNVGFDAIDAIADKYDIYVAELKHRAKIGKGYIGGDKVILAKPLTFMNLSGESVRAIIDYYKVEPETELIVISDDIAKLATLAFGFCSVIVALMRPGLISDILALANGGVAALAPAMLGGIYWKKATPQGALSSILIGEAVMLFTTFIVPNPLGLMAGLWGLIAALIVFAAVSLATRPVKTTIDVVDSLNHFFAAE